MQLDLRGRHALVGGASAGIGRAAAIELASLGANVTLLARSADALRGVREQACRGRMPSQHHQWRQVDMLDTAALAAIAAEMVADRPGAHPHQQHRRTGRRTGQCRRPGGVRGGLPPAPDRRADPAAALLPGMRAEGYGRLVNVISTSVKEPIAGLGVSNTVRAAVAGWAKTLAGELAADGITVNNVLPGYTRTDRMDSLLASQAEASGRTRRRSGRQPDEDRPGPPLWRSGRSGCRDRLPLHAGGGLRQRRQHCRGRRPHARAQLSGSGPSADRSHPCGAMPHRQRARPLRTDPVVRPPPAHHAATRGPADGGSDLCDVNACALPPRR